MLAQSERTAVLRRPKLAVSSRWLAMPLEPGETPVDGMAFSPKPKGQSFAGLRGTCIYLAELLRIPKDGE